MKALYQQIKRRREAEGLSTNAGFTLIELLIVIVVLGILAGVVIFALGGVTGKSAIAACQADGATVSTAMSAWSAQNPSGNVTEADLVGANNGLQSWPSNSPHYIYFISGSTDAAVTPAAATSFNVGGTATTEPAGTLMLDKAPVGAVTGSATTDTWVPYNGPSACASVA